MPMVIWSENCPICGTPSEGCLMQMLMAGETLTTEELMYLQDFDNLKDLRGKKVPFSVITHYECWQRYQEGSVQFLKMSAFRQVMNWNDFPKVLLQRFSIGN